MTNPFSISPSMILLAPTSSSYNNNINYPSKKVASELLTTLVTPSNVTTTPQNYSLTVNYSLARKSDLGHKKRLNPCKVLSHMPHSIHSNHQDDNKNLVAPVLNKVLNYNSYEKTTYIDLDLTKTERNLLALILSHINYETGQILISKIGLAAKEECNRSTVTRFYKKLISKKIVKAGKQSIKKNGDWGTCKDYMDLGQLSVVHFMHHTLPYGSNKTNNITSHSEELRIKKPKIPFSARDPEKEIEVKDAWPWRKAEKYLAKEFGNTYLAQKPVIDDYNRWLVSQGKTKMKRREYNYGLYPFCKKRKELVGKYGYKRIPLAKLLNHRQKPEIEIKPEIKKQKPEIEHKMLPDTDWTKTIQPDIMARGFEELRSRWSN